MLVSQAWKTRTIKGSLILGGQSLVGRHPKQHRWTWRWHRNHRKLEKTGTWNVHQGKPQEMSQQKGHVAVTKVPTGLGLPSPWYSPCPKLRFNPCLAESQSLSLVPPTPQCDVELWLPAILCDLQIKLRWSGPRVCMSLSWTISLPLDLNFWAIPRCWKDWVCSTLYAS